MATPPEEEQEARLRARFNAHEAGQSTPGRWAAAATIQAAAVLALDIVSR